MFGERGGTRTLDPMIKSHVTEQILKGLRDQGFDILGDGVLILRKSMSRSGRFLVACRRPTTLWKLKAAGTRAPQRLSNIAEGKRHGPLLDQGTPSGAARAVDRSCRSARRIRVALRGRPGR